MKGVSDPYGKECKLSGQADDMLLALLPLAGSLEAALAIIDDLSLLSGCRINWKKTKVICVWLDETPVCLRHIERITGDSLHVYLGLPYMEGEENAEVGRRICICFIGKARALQVVEMSLPARVLAMNHILAASLWYFLFAWASTVADFKRLQEIINNVLWAKPVDNPKSYSKVAWNVITQKKVDGGLGLVDPFRKTQILHGQWILKAFSPGVFLWRNYMLYKLDAISAVPNGTASRFMALPRRPREQFDGGSPLWMAMWKSWMSIRDDLQWSPLENYLDAACLPIQGFSKIWTEQRCQQLERSSRITSAVASRVKQLADLWHWDAERWYTKRELRRMYPIPRCTTKALFEAVTADLQLNISQAMTVNVTLQAGMQVTDQAMHIRIPHWSTQSALQVTCITPSLTQVRAYQVLSEEGLLAQDYQLCAKDTNSLHPITVVTRTHKCKWNVVEDTTPELRQEVCQRAWLGQCCKAKLPLLVQRWCWSSKNQILLN